LVSLPGLGRHDLVPVDVERVGGEHHPTLSVLVGVGAGLAVAEVDAGPAAALLGAAAQKGRRVLAGEEHDGQDEDESSATEAPADRHTAPSAAAGGAYPAGVGAHAVVERHAPILVRGRRLRPRAP